MTDQTHGEEASLPMDSEVESSFQSLNEVLCTTSILAHPQPRERFVIDTDTSNLGIGGVLSQVQNGQE
jgi:hypothetical protein